MTHQIQVEVITPVHVGMGLEKKLLSGLDFIYKDDQYHILNPDKILYSLDRKEIDMVSQYLASNSLIEINSFIQKNNNLLKSAIRYTWQSSFGNAQEIRPAYCDGAGKYFIPGSSIKGVLRGILLTKLSDENHGRMDETAFMGRIDNNLMRFLQVTDCYFNQNPGIYPVKVFSADLDMNQRVGKWKDMSRGGHSDHFNSQKFVTFYEMLTDGENSEKSIGNFRINWGGNELIRNNNHGRVPNLGNIFEHPTGIKYLFNAARENTRRHLEREFLFFESYTNNNLGESFYDEINWLKEQNDENEDESCLIRLGANVGWHSITGNWRYQDHIGAVERNRGKMVGNMEKAYKTRKLGFDSTDSELYRFFLPGFVKLTLVSE